MGVRTDAGNVATYRRWAPVYDAVLGRLFAGARRRAIALLNLQQGERVVLPGVGTGLDLPLLSAGVSAVGRRPQSGHARPRAVAAAVARP